MGLSIHSNHLFLSVVLAVLVDQLIGDPSRWLHPVQMMGWVIQRYVSWVLPLNSHPHHKRWAGVVLACLLVGGCGVVTWGFVHVAAMVNPWLGASITTMLVASCLAGRSLQEAANDVLTPLQDGNLSLARHRLSHYVGRDTTHLSREEILRAILETITENAVDGVTAPLFYAFLGAGLSSVCIVDASLAAPWAMAYKALSTLDSMVGYQQEPYRDIGWFSARLEDFATWLPCRLHVLTLAVLSGQPLTMIRICQRDAPHDPSPNSGWSECIYASRLGVQLGGDNYYHGRLKSKPLLGNAIHPITPQIIEAAFMLTRDCIVSWVTIALLVSIVYGFHTLN